MNLTRPIIVLTAALALAGPLHASPGAHGPNGEHLDGPPAAVSAGVGAPRLQAHSELFEIVGAVESGRFVFTISRYDSNEAVLGAAVELELGALKAAAQFESASGSYAVADAPWLAALAKPGTHALVFTVKDGATTDLLDGALVVVPAAPVLAGGVSGAGAAPLWAWAALCAAVLSSTALVLVWRPRRHAAAAPEAAA